MKTKKIILCLIVIVNVGLTIIVKQNTKKIIMQDGAILALTLDGKPIAEFPSSTNYRVEIDCTNGRGKLLSEDGTWKFSLDSIEGDIFCYIDFYSRTENDILVNKITSLAGTTQGEGKLVHEEVMDVTNTTFTPDTILEQSDYMNVNNDTTYPWTWNETDKTWTSSNKGSEAAESASIITFKPNLDGYYQICYIQSPESVSGEFAVVVNNELKYSNSNEPLTNFKCENLGKLTTADTIKVGNYNIDYYETAFYIQIVLYNEIYEKVDDAGYRYEGTNPNNYIWFNNEMWRIIGSIPTKIDANGTTKNLAKIIRNDSLGGITYDGKSYGNYTGAWGSNTLYTLLNNYYYGKKDGTDTAYCYGYKNKSKSKCDYRVNGISSESTDYYGRMVKNVYWNTGAASDETAGMVYIEEKVIQTVQGRIGLMSLSDYGYAASLANHNSTSLSSYGTEDIPVSNWLNSQSEEFTNTQSSVLEDYVFVVYSDGDIGTLAQFGSNVRPVVYLDENIYVLSGDGTEANPYIIGM